MKVLDTINVDMPEYAIYFLEYGEDGSLSNEDITNIDKFINRLKSEYDNKCYFTFSYDNLDNHFFTHSPEFGLPCTCVDCTITVFESK